MTFIHIVLYTLLAIMFAIAFITDEIGCMVIVALGAFLVIALV